LQESPPFGGLFCFRGVSREERKAEGEFLFVFEFRRDGSQIRLRILKEFRNLADPRSVSLVYFNSIFQPQKTQNSQKKNLYFIPKARQWTPFGTSTWLLSLVEVPLNDHGLRISGLKCFYDLIFLAPTGQNVNSPGSNPVVTVH